MVKAARKRKLLKETNWIKDEAITSMHAVGTVIDFEEDGILLDGEKIEKKLETVTREVKERRWGETERGYFENRMKAVIYGWDKI